MTGMLKALHGIDAIHLRDERHIVLQLQLNDWFPILLTAATAHHVARSALIKVRHVENPGNLKLAIFDNSAAVVAVFAVAPPNNTCVVLL